MALTAYQLRELRHLTTKLDSGKPQDVIDFVERVSRDFENALQSICTVEMCGQGDSCLSVHINNGDKNKDYLYSDRQKIGNCNGGFKILFTEALNREYGSPTLSSPSAAPVQKTPTGKPPLNEGVQQALPGSSFSAMHSTVQDRETGGNRDWLTRIGQCFGFRGHSR